MLFAGAVLLIVFRFDHFIAAIRSVVSASIPILIGLILAFILNILMVKFEKIYFPKSDNKKIIKSRRPVVLLLSVLTVPIVFYIVGGLVIPQFIDSIQVVIGALPQFAQNLWDFAVKRGLDPTEVGISPDLWNQPSSQLIQRVMELGRNFLGGFLSVITSVFGLFTNVLMGLGFAIFLLAGKEKILTNIGRVMKAYLPIETVRTIYRNSAVVNDTFRDFFAGQFTVAAILGIITTIALFIFQYPHVTMIGSVIALMDIIPIIGPFIGGAIGALILFLEDPMKAVWFVLFILILQQVESNIIYPRIVGGSIGLGGIWVFAAVILGTGIFGILGALLAVPIVASVYKILKYDVEKIEEERRGKIEEEMDREIEIVEH